MGARTLRDIKDAPDFPELVQDGWYLDINAAVSMSAVAKAPTMVIAPKLRKIRQNLDQASTGKKRVGISFYEWNVMWDRPGDAISGVFAAGMLNFFCREAEPLGLEFAGYFQPVSEGAIRVGPTSSQLEPAGEVFGLCSVHQGNTGCSSFPPCGMMPTSTFAHRSRRTGSASMCLPSTEV